MVQLDHFCIDCNNVIGTMVVESSITQGLAPPKRVHLQILNESSVEEGVKRKLSLLQKSVGGMHDKVMKLAAVSVHLFELTEGAIPSTSRRITVEESRSSRTDECKICMAENNSLAGCDCVLGGSQRIF